MGPTAAGKSALALAVAEARSDVELVALDAMTVYRGMDIGTAKPTPAEQVAGRYHGLDLADPADEVSVVRVADAARAALVDIAARGRRAVLVGGTGLYLRAVIDDLAPPGEWPELRARFESDPDLSGLYARLQILDPLAASRIEPGNRRRIARALEVCEGSGRPFSSFGPGLTAYPAVPTAQIGLHLDRQRLAERIAHRFRSMLDGGLLDEVRALRDRPGGLSRTARQALGYKELLDHLDGICSLEDAVALAVARTRQFAVRQERWFRRDPRIRWIDVSDGNAIAALPCCLEALERCP